MKFFLYYIKRRKNTIFLLGLILLIFLFIFYLYNLPIQGIVYPYIVSFAVSAVIGFFDYRKVKKKYDNLEALRSIQDITDADILSLARDCDNTDIMLLLCRQKYELVGNELDKFNDMIEYYIAWAHQIKTPIASMRLNLQNEDSPMSRALQSDLFRIEQYVNMVLTYLRLDSSSTDYVIKEYDLDSIVKGCVKKYASDFINKKIKLDYKPLNCSVLTDEKWLGFVIEQILSNSLKYTESGNVSIYCEDNFLVIADTGIGIDEADLPRVFEKGYTGLNGRLNGKSSGLGLYLVGRVCKNLHQSISIDSKVGEGTQVKIDLTRSNVEIE